MKTPKEYVGLFKVGLELFISQGPKIIDAIRNVSSAGYPVKSFLMLLESGWFSAMGMLSVQHFSLPHGDDRLPHDRCNVRAPFLLIRLK